MAHKIQHSPDTTESENEVLVILTEAFEGYQISSDAKLEELRGMLDQTRRERDALEDLLRRHGLDATAVLAGLRARPARRGAAEHLAQRLQDQLATLAALRASLMA